MYKLFTNVSLLMVATGCLLGQSKDVVTMEEVTVVASGSEKKMNDVPYSVQRLSGEDMQMHLQTKSFVDALDSIPGVMMQKTGHGMSSPYLRGQTASRTVLMVDGVKLNNSILREGPNQYWNTVDPFFFDQVDLLMGPTSVLYGSDAIGGTVYVSSTLDRGVSGAGLQWLGGEAMYRYSSGEDSHSAHIKGSFAYEDKFSLKMGFTRQDFGELRSGGGYDNELTNFDDWGINLRGQYWFDNDHSFYFGADLFQQNDVDRVHKTTAAEPWHGITAGKDTRRTYDHSRDALFGRYQVRNGNGLIHEMDLGLSYQFVEENYFADRLASKNRTEKADTKVGTVATNLRLQTLSDFGTWDYGFEFSKDKVDASKVYFKDDGSVSVKSQGLVADDADYYTYGLYLQNSYSFNENWEWINGVRYTWTRMEAGKTVIDGTLQSLNGNWDSPAFSTRLLWHVIPEELTIYGGISTGFRAPNLSDATRDDEFGGGDEAPTADLDAEKFVSYELGTRWHKKNGFLNGAVYYTQMYDRIARIKYPVNTKRNLDSGYIYGFEISGEYYLNNSWSLFGDLSWQYGSEENYSNRDLDAGTTDLPVSRIMPLTATTGIRYEPVAGQFWSEFYISMADKQDRLAEAEKTDNRFPEDGTPGYAILNARAGYRLTKSSSFTASVENILDESYRIHGSGVNESGVNFILSLRTSF